MKKILKKEVYVIEPENVVWSPFGYGKVQQKVKLE